MALGEFAGGLWLEGDFSNVSPPPTDAVGAAGASHGGSQVASPSDDLQRAYLKPYRRARSRTCAKMHSMGMCRLRHREVEVSEGLQDRCWGVLRAQRSPCHGSER